MKITFFGCTNFHFYTISKWTPKNWFVSWLLIILYGASDLRFQSKKEFLIFAKFFKKYFNWCFAIATFKDYDNAKHHCFTGAKNKRLLRKHEEER